MNRAIYVNCTNCSHEQILGVIMEDSVNVKISIHEFDGRTICDNCGHTLFVTITVVDRLM